MFDKFNDLFLEYSENMVNKTESIIMQGLFQKESKFSEFMTNFLKIMKSYNFKQVTSRKYGLSTNNYIFAKKQNDIIILVLIEQVFQKKVILHNKDKAKIYIWSEFDLLTPKNGIQCKTSENIQTLKNKIYNTVLTNGIALSSNENNDKILSSQLSTFIDKNIKPIIATQNKTEDQNIADSKYEEDKQSKQKKAKLEEKAKKNLEKIMNNIQTVLSGAGEYNMFKTMIENISKINGISTVTIKELKSKLK